LEQLKKNAQPFINRGLLLLWIIKHRRVFWYNKIF
jgi:hypothetical protein